MIDTVSWPYINWRNAKRWGRDTAHMEVGVQDYPMITIDDEYYPFFKLALMHKYREELSSQDS